MRKSNYITQLAILLVSLVLTQTAFADVKIKTHQTVGGQSFEGTTLIKGKRQRTEQNMGGMETVNITECDLKRSIQIATQAQTYMIDNWQTAQNVTPSTTTTTEKMPSNTEKGGTIAITYTTKDTGERKQMFGYTARHLIITTETKSSPDACTPTNSKTVTDGWYIDATFALDCDTERYKNYNPYNNQKPTCQDHYQTKQIGTAKRGYPVYEKMTMFDESGKEMQSFINEVVELSNATLDAALFDVPAGFREVKNSTELYASMSAQNSKPNSYAPTNSISNSNGSDYGLAANVKNMAAKSQNASTTEVGAKKAGVVRIGLASVKTGSVGEGMNAAELAGAIQNSLSEYLKTPQIELVRLESKLQSAIDAEAKAKECDYVIYANVSHKKGGGGFGFGKAFGAAIAQTGIGHTGSVAGNIAGQIATTTIVSAANLSANVKAKDELTLDIRVNSANGAAMLAKQYKAKAKSDGEDIISPIIEQAAQAILDAVVKK